MPSDSFLQWLGAAIDDLGLGNVRLTENRTPLSDKYDDYTVVLEVSLESTPPNAARLTLWRTDDDRIAVGIDEVTKVASRQHIKTARRGFAAGHEPLSVPLAALRELISMIARGQVAIRLRKMPLIGLIGSEAVASVADVRSLQARGYPTDHWLIAVSASQLENRNTVRFDAWT